jgi:hypothetical protein
MTMMAIPAKSNPLRSRLLAAAGQGLDTTKPVWINVWMLRLICKHCPFVLCIFGTCLILLCIAFIQIGYEWPVRHESPCFEQVHHSFD